MRFLWLAALLVSTVAALAAPADQEVRGIEVPNCGPGRSSMLRSRLARIRFANAVVSTQAAAPFAR
jgi:hypothetical protein